MCTLFLVFSDRNNYKRIWVNLFNHNLRYMYRKIKFMLTFTLLMNGANLLWCLMWYNVLRVNRVRLYSARWNTMCLSYNCRYPKCYTMIVNHYIETHGDWIFYPILLESGVSIIMPSFVKRCTLCEYCPFT
jgi:hypothetical protein